MPGPALGRLLVSPGRGFWRPEQILGESSSCPCLHPLFCVRYKMIIITGILKKIQTSTKTKTKAHIIKPPGSPMTLALIPTSSAPLKEGGRA